MNPAMYLCKKSVTGSVAFQSFPEFLNLSGSCREKSARPRPAPYHNASPLEAPSNDLELPKISITHKLALNQNRVSLIFDSEKF